MNRLQALAVVAVFLMAMACEPIVAQRGHMDQDKLQEKLEVGKTTKSQVERLFGSPSSTSNFGDETWYYIQARKESEAFFRPEITYQHVLQVTFDESGLIKDIKHYGKDTSERVAIVEKTTPTEGHSMGFMEQVMGNVGRFNKDRDVGTSARRR